MTTNPLAALIILDGFALREDSYGNAVKQANTPHFDDYWNSYPHATLKAFGESVGLPEGQMGNSEVGHLNIGAGRIVYQSLSRINLEIEKRHFHDNKAFLRAIEHVKKKDSQLHIFGLLSDGGVHSHINHIHALLETAREQQVEKVYVHAFLDGRDVGPKTALQYIDQLQAKMIELGVGKLASVVGRFYAMDRDHRWERVEKAYRALRFGEGRKAKLVEAAVQASYSNQVVDEFVEPIIVVDQNEEPLGVVSDDDAVIFANFRPDRAIQLTDVFSNNRLDVFENKYESIKDLYFVTMTQYSEEFKNVDVAYPPSMPKNTIGEVVSSYGYSQLRIAETEKYPHVTYFMNGGIEEKFPGEKRILIDSPKVATYDLKPEMSAYEVTDALLKELDESPPNLIILNFANPDMVGHSGKLEPTVKAVEAVDDCLGKIVNKIIKLGGTAVITADHGNADQVLTDDGTPMTAHTTNPVPVIVTKEGLTLREDGILGDLAPTLLQLLNIKKPAEMTGHSLIKNDEMERL